MSIETTLAWVLQETEKKMSITNMNSPILFNDLDHLAGLWMKEEAAEFDKALAEQRNIDEGLWNKQSSP